MTKDQPVFTPDQAASFPLAYFETGIESGFGAGYRQGYEDAVSDTLCSLRAHLAAAFSAEELEELGFGEVLRGFCGLDEREAPAPSLAARLSAFASRQLQELRGLLAT